MIDEVMLDREILDQIEAYDLDLSEDNWEGDVPVEELSYEVLELL
jgi:hypothetical protein